MKMIVGEVVAFAALAAFGVSGGDCLCHGGFSRFRFDAGEKVPALYYDAYGPMERGSSAEVAVVVIHGWGGHVRTLLPTFTKALSLRAETPEKMPYVIAPLFPRRETLKTNREPDDGRVDRRAHAGGRGGLLLFRERTVV